jgi:catechol 2,3-dioxygenase-like lactoylglutathione lyase family enzyme
MSGDCRPELPSGSTQLVAFGLARISLNFGDPVAMTALYRDALGFAAASVIDGPPALPALLGVRCVRTVLLRRGQQSLELCACDPPGAAMPDGGRSNDLWFQHCAISTTDIRESYARLRCFPFMPISRDGPQALPGGIVAFKFRDPDGHPLELIQFPQPDPLTVGGIDHSAICVADPERSIAFSAARLGLGVRARQVNHGPAQDALDALDQATVDVIALAPAAAASPHVELLGYRHPPGRAALPFGPADIAASRLVFTVGDRPGEQSPELLHDPDGHAVLLNRGHAAAERGFRMATAGLSREA